MGTSRVLRKRSLLFKASALSSSGRWSVLWGAADPGIQSDQRQKKKMVSVPSSLKEDKTGHLHKAK